MILRSVRGTHDIYGKEILKFNRILNVVSKKAKISGFSEIITPIFEFSELFAKPLGEQTDVVLKEMYSFEDKNKENLTLRPEYTTPMIRAAITNSLLNELPLKLFGAGPMFRRERPQKGRYRQFNQINFEILGSNDYLADVELIFVANEILKKLLPNIQIILNLNNLGTKENLIDFKKSLTDYFNYKKNKLSKESTEKIENNPLRILDSKNEQDIEISKNAPLIKDFISKESKEHQAKIIDSLNFLQINFIEDLNLVRGLDYYCSTVFEFKTENLGSQNTILGGGRYDGLVNVLGGPDIAGIGWAAGIERIAMLMQDNLNDASDVHIAITDRAFTPHLLKLIQFFNSKNISYNWNYKFNLKKSLSKANKLKANKIIIIGENEIKGNFYTLKDLESSNQNKLNLNQLDKYFDDKN